MKRFAPLSLVLMLTCACAIALSDEPASDELVVVVGVPEALGREVHDTAEAILERAPYPHRVVALDELAPGTPSGAGRLVALGAAACERLAATARPLTCALLSAEAFAAIPCPRRCELLRAIVMDQPASRQIAVARAVYPSLRRFGVLSGQPPPAGEALPAGSSIAYHRFRDDTSLPSQLEATIVAGDALLVQSESSIFNRSSLHVVLLTAYGHAKPVIGFGQAYVRAGALISAYSTPEQILHEVLGSDAPAAADGTPVDVGPRTRSPTRFSIAENPRVARSLGLVRRVDIDPARAYSDGDFVS